MNNGNQLNKGISVGHIVATVGLIIGGFAFIYDLRESVAIQSFQLESVEGRLGRDIEWKRVALRAYFFWSVCVDMAALTGILWYIFK